jgi:Ankyrin repeats (many copies)
VPPDGSSFRRRELAACLAAVLRGSAESWLEANTRDAYEAVKWNMEDDWYKREQLHFAAMDGDLDRARELIGAGYDVNAFDEGMRYTPLHYAAIGEFAA